MSTSRHKSISEKDVFTSGEVAAIFNVSTQTVNKWIDKEVLKGFRVPHSTHRRVTRKELELFIRKQNISVTGFRFANSICVLICSEDALFISQIKDTLDHSIEMYCIACPFDAAYNLSKISPDVFIFDIAENEEKLSSAVTSLSRIANREKIPIMLRAAECSKFEVLGGNSHPMILKSISIQELYLRIKELGKLRT